MQCKVIISYLSESHDFDDEWYRDSLNIVTFSEITHFCDDESIIQFKNTVSASLVKQGHSSVSVEIVKLS